MSDVLGALHGLLAHRALVVTLAGVSLVTFVAGVVGVPLFLARLPADYFARSERGRLALSQPKRPLSILLRLGKNALGAVLVALGLLMLVLPGQGILTLLAGLLLLDLPGKYRIERRILATPRVLGVVNALRKRWHRPPLEL